MKKKILISAANGPIMRSLILLLKKKDFILLVLMQVLLVMPIHFAMNFTNHPKEQAKLFQNF